MTGKTPIIEWRDISKSYGNNNAPDAFAVGDRYTVLLQGRVAASFSRGEKTLDELTSWMAGGKKIAEDATP